MSARNNNLDALRAIAALLVLWHHTSEVFLQYLQSGEVHGKWVLDVAQALGFGNIGVVAFFAISGYVIPASLRGNDRLAQLKKFGINRFFRLYPAFWVSILPGVYACHMLWGKEMSAHDIALNFTMIPEWLGARAAMGQYWSLQLELLFYVMCAALFAMKWLHQPRKLILIALGMLVFFALVRRGIYAYNVSYLCIMFFGAMCRKYKDSNTQPADRKWLQIAIMLFTAFWLVIFPAYGVFAIHQGIAQANLSSVFLSYAIGILLFLVAIGTKDSRPGVCSWLGRISYSIYLLHPVVFYPMLWWFSRTPALREMGWHLGTIVGISALLTILLSTIVYYVVEAPSVRLGKRLVKRLVRSSGEHART
ncbi:acyltransferase [Diaphorobacter sp. HDW4B]|uniref:acyltransferase family protein n=1 Tax=Diaphorobacter sp. HDW4B TaxID=2714925 RepID=UPI001407AF3F|nr:acyltransferase [Diaphorobacter sp. HDW4B]QIL71014.1 acyltransferase [Diaphorobacter sp. HDW4B]